MADIVNAVADVFARQADTIVRRATFIARAHANYRRRTSCMPTSFGFERGEICAAFELGADPLLATGALNELRFLGGQYQLNGSAPA